MFEILVLSIIQGITEFLPISSSAHLIILSDYFNFNNANLKLDISLHLGSLLAVTLFFKKDILNFIQQKTLILKIIVGSLPTLIFGFFLIKLNLIDQFRNAYIISLTTIFFGIMLYFSDKSESKNYTITDLNIKDAVFIGFLQCLSLIPGVSRSGVTLTGARFLKYNRVEAAKISFLFSIPTLFAVCFYNFFKLIELKSLQISFQNFWAVIFSFIFSLIVLEFFIDFLKKFSLTFFVIYRLLLGILILIYVFNN